MSRDAKLHLLAAGAVSGSVWFLVALAFDKGVRDYNYPVIPTNSVLAALGSLLAAIVTGIGVTFAFRAVWVTRSRLLWCMAPVLTLASALTAFSALTWLVWLAFGNTSGIPRLHRLADIAGFFLVYGLISPLLSPPLYVLAYVNQIAMRRVARRVAA